MDLLLRSAMVLLLLQGMALFQEGLLGNFPTQLDKTVSATGEVVQTVITTVVTMKERLPTVFLALGLIPLPEISILPETIITTAHLWIDQNLDHHHLSREKAALEEPQGLLIPE